jgi:hypothetical protein
MLFSSTRNTSFIDLGSLRPLQQMVGSVFISEEFKKFAADMGIKLIRSSLYYAQANGQAEASNQSLIKLIKRKIDEYPRRWHEVLSEALWA